MAPLELSKVQLQSFLTEPTPVQQRRGMKYQNMASRSDPPLLALSPELRNRVYEEASHEQVVNLDYRRTSLPRNLLAYNKLYDKCIGP